MTKTGMLVVCAMIAAGAAAAADDAAMPAPDKALDAVKPLVKSWSCTGTNPMNEKGSAKVTYKKELGGFWFSLDFKAAKTKTAPEIEGMAVFGQDPAKKDWMMEGWDNMGGTLHVRSKDGMAWTGTSVDQGKETPATVTFAYDAKTKHHAFTVTVNGQKAFDYDCK